MKSLNAIVLVLASVLSLAVIGCTEDEMKDKEGVPISMRWALQDYQQSIRKCIRPFGPGHKEVYRSFYIKLLVKHTKLESKEIVDRAFNSSKELSRTWEKYCSQRDMPSVSIKGDLLEEI